MKILTLLFLLCPAFYAAAGQESVFFFAADSSRVNGDLYINNNRLPFIILCHQEGLDRSAYHEVAPRLMHLNYNCLAIDLRSVTSLDATADIKAAMQYVRNFSTQPVILFGSSWSASLCLIVAAEDPSVKAIVALSPGEFFQPRIAISREVKKLHQQVFVTATQVDYPYLKTMLSGMPADLVTWFKPEKGKGSRGLQALYPSDPASSEYWFALMMFFKGLGSN
jgi:pimeloyl-ACP methyl ester carboxylesterase